MEKPGAAALLGFSHMTHGCIAGLDPVLMSARVLMPCTFLLVLQMTASAAAVLGMSETGSFKQVLVWVTRDAEVSMQRCHTLHAVPESGQQPDHKP